MGTFKTVIKHAGSSIVSVLTPAESITDASLAVDKFMGQWRQQPLARDTGWYPNEDEGVNQRDLITEPGEGEHHFLFRFTFKE